MKRRSDFDRFRNCPQIGDISPVEAEVDEAAESGACLACKSNCVPCSLIRFGRGRDMAMDGRGHPMIGA